MKPIYNLIAAIILIIGLLILMRQCEQPPEVITKIDTVYTEITKHDIQYDTVIKEKIIPKDTIILHDTIKLSDTIWIYEDYSNKYVYIDSIFKPDTLELIVIDTLQYNRLLSRSTKLKTFNKTTTLYTEHNEIFINGGFMFNGQYVYFVGADFNYKKFIIGTALTTDKQLLFKLGYKIK
jgi:hypothetical protein